MNISYRKANVNDVDLLINIYNVSFYDDYIRYGECPAYNRTKENMKNSILHFPKIIFSYKDKAVGVISYNSDENGNYYIGCFCVIPDYQGKGIGTKAFKYLLSMCQDWKTIKLVTPADNKKNIEFYTKKCGFEIKDKKMDGNVEVVEFYKEKL